MITLGKINSMYFTTFNCSKVAWQINLATTPILEKSHMLKVFLIRIEYLVLTISNVSCFS